MRSTCVVVYVFSEKWKPSVPGVASGFPPGFLVTGFPGLPAFGTTLRKFCRISSTHSAAHIPQSVTLKNKKHRLLALLAKYTTSSEFGAIWRQNISALANSVNSGIVSCAHAHSGNVLYTCTLRCRMSLVACTRFFRPCLSRIRPVLSPPRLNGCRLFSSLQKRPNFVFSRLLARHASGGNEGFGALLSENGLLVLGFGLLGGSLAYVSISLKRCCYCSILQTVYSVFEFPTVFHFRFCSQFTKSASIY